jgi:hypothetical protein
MTHGYKMMINHNKEYLRRKSCHFHKLAIDRGALAMMCGRDEKPHPNVTTCWKIIMVRTRYKAMNTHCR